MALFAFYSTIGPKGLFQILLVFGSMTKDSRVRPSPTQIDPVRAIDSAIREAKKEQSCRRIDFGLAHPSAEKVMDNSAILNSLPAEEPMVVYRTK